MGHVFAAAMNAVEEDRRGTWMAGVEDQLATGRYPHFGRLLAEGHPPADPDDHFDRGLKIVLDGIELALSRPRP